MRGRSKKKPTENGRPALSQVWLRKVGDEGNSNRLRLPRAIGLVVPWLPTDSVSIDALAWIGASGGVAITPPHEMNLLRRSLETRVAGRTATISDSGTAWLGLTRYLAASWPIPIQAEQSRFSLTLPEDARKLGLAPLGGEHAVVFVANGIIEVWRADRWCEFMRQTTSSFEKMKLAAFEELSSLVDET